MKTKEQTLFPPYVEHIGTFLEAGHATNIRNLVVHSSLLGISRQADDLPLIDGVLRRSLAEKATIVVPTYTLDGAADPWDRDQTASRGMGVFSEYVRRLPNAIRSYSPMHSHAGVGPEASVLCESDRHKPIGPGSDFQSLVDANFSLLLLGTTFSSGCTFLHHVEALAQVPYREIVEIEREVISGGLAKRVTLQYFGRKSPKVKVDFDKLVPILAERGVLQSGRLGAGKQIHLIRLELLQEIALETLRRDSLFFLSNPWP